MKRHATRSGILAMVAATVLAACQSGPSSSSPAASPASTPFAASAAPATVPPTVQPAPSASASCPGALPTTLAVEDLADPACYGTTELTLEGWLADTSFDVSSGERTPGWTNAFSGLYASSPTIDHFIIDFLLHSPDPRVWVVTAPNSGINLSDLGRWASVRGHFNDPEALTCTVAPDPDYPADKPPVLDCERLFVVTAIEALDRPAPACPSESPVSLATFMAADATCFRDRTVQVSGWGDQGEGFGGMAPIFPISTGSLELANAQFVSHRWEDGDENLQVIFPWTVVGSGVTFDRSDREVVVTAVLGGSAAASCKPDYDAWTWAPPDSWAQHRCDHLLVITRVRDIG